MQRYSLLPTPCSLLPTPYNLGRKYLTQLINAIAHELTSSIF
ncbi:hypothetical protein [Moorena sp. SIOASIH]|nr:hypothetical protein [Moorena sp. SIOASIH]